VQTIVGVTKAQRTGNERPSSILAPQALVTWRRHRETGLTLTQLLQGIGGASCSTEDLNDISSEIWDVEKGPLPSLKCECGCSVTKRFLSCPECKISFIFDEHAQPQFAAPAIKAIYAGVTTVRQARKLAFNLNEARSEWKIMKKRLQEFMRHRERWINDDKYRVDIAAKGMVFEVPGA
jgi:hypothetical protein